MIRIFYSIFLMGLISGFCFSESLQLPTVFSDHMVLQREQAVPVWGTAEPGATVTIEFAGQTKTAVADFSNHWKIMLDPMPASSEPRKLTVSCNQKSGIINRQFSDVLVGEVWFCSGQSNMDRPMALTENAAEAIAAANHPQIRLYNTARSLVDIPVETIDSSWEVCTPRSVKLFSGVAYYFGRKLQRDLNVPIGLIKSAWGGTCIETWTPPCGFEGIESLADIHEKVQKTVPSSPIYREAMGEYIDEIQNWIGDAQKALDSKDYVENPPVLPAGHFLGGDQQMPTKLFRGMVHAHVPYAIRGAIWYQGESNRADGMLYVDKTKALVNGWRRLWGYDVPFYFVQITPFQYGKEDPDILPRFWEAQSEILKEVPNTGMVVASDATTLDDIHPPNKEVPGIRLALLAEANDYGMDVVCSGPVFQGLEKQGRSLKVLFDSAEGLATRDGKAPDWFEVAGEDGRFEKARTEIQGSSVTVSSGKVPEPVAVRFAWHKLAVPNLVNAAGLPASAFRAGDFPEPKSLLETVSEAAGFRTIYQLDVPLDADYGKSAPAYAVDNSASDDAPFSRVAYFLELEKKDGATQYVFVSMDRFADDLKKLAVPVVSTGARFLQKVSNLTVRSNVDGVVNCVDFDGGSIELWPGNYSPQNAKMIPRAEEKRFDFGDNCSGKIPGYGCLQVHNWKDKQTVLAFNRWGLPGPVELGIGSAPTGHPDWTLSKNGGQYVRRQLTILVK